MVGQPLAIDQKDSKSLHSDELTLTVASILDSAALVLLHQTVYGTVGIRYVQTGQKIKSANLHDPLFFHLYQNAQLVGLYCLDRRRLTGLDQPVAGYYGRYLTVSATVQGLGYGKLLKQAAIAYVEQNTADAHLFYSYIEEKNTRSMVISERMGFKSVATLKTFFYRRWRPTPDDRVQQATADDTKTVQSLLQDEYETYTLKTFDRVGYQQQYFVIRKKGQVVAGVQANPVRWQFRQVTLFGSLHLSNWFIRAVSRVPLLNRILNLENYRFAALEGIYLRPGYENLLPVLLDGMLHRLGLHTAMLLVDENDPVVARLKTLTTGLSGFKNDVRTHVMVRAIGLPGNALGRSPVYVSSFDFT